MKLFIILFLGCVVLQNANSQPPAYTPKHFVALDNPEYFRRIVPKKEGFLRTYLLTSSTIWDVDDKNATHIKGSQKVLLCIEGQYKNSKRNGIFKIYVIDSADNKRLYKIGEQEYLNDSITGEWRTYNLRGTLVLSEMYRNNRPFGITTMYWIDGKRIMEQHEFFEDANKEIATEYSDDGKKKQSFTLIKNIPNGVAKKFYPTGVLMQDAILVDGVPNGVSRYYYPSGILWIEKIMKNDHPWTIVANYNQQGLKREAGTLQDGNGTIIYYNEDGTVREVITYKNGIEKD